MCIGHTLINVTWFVYNEILQQILHISCVTRDGKSRFRKFLAKNRRSHKISNSRVT